MNLNDISLAGFLPLAAICILLGLVFIFFRIFGITARILWRLLINGLIGAGMLCLFDIIFGVYLGMEFFYIPITWLSSITAGVLGIPGVILLLILKFII